jgi:ADP-ribose pyrophosphatase YjhB (NUDIX family)
MPSPITSPSASELITAFPEAQIIETKHTISAEDFAAQKAKQIARRSDGGAIGVVWLDDGTIPLVSRTQAHAGWALPGGTVEQGESYTATFEREILEEVGVRIALDSLRLVLLEHRTFVSPTNEQVHLHMAVFEANALPGEIAQQTAEATEEGLTVQVFALDALPETLIFDDKGKIQQAAARRNLGAH